MTAGRSSEERCASCGTPMAVLAGSELRYCGKKCRKRGRNRQYRANRAERGIPRCGPVPGETREAWQERRKDA